MIIKTNLYTIVNIYDNKVLLLKNENDLYCFPTEYNVYTIKKIYDIPKKNYRTNKLTMEKWFSHLDRSYLSKLRQVTRRNDFADSFIQISNMKVTYPNGIYVELSNLLNLSFTISSYPYLIGILSKQLLLEQQYTEISKHLIGLEKKDNKNYELWKKYINQALDFNSYVAAKKVFRLYDGKTTILQDYTKELKKDIEFVNKARIVIKETHQIIDEILEHKENYKKAFMEQGLNSEFCYIEDIINYTESFKNHDLIYTYFSRTKDETTCSQYISYLIEQNNPENEKEIEALFELNILKSTSTYDDIMSQIYHSGYLILNNKYQQALELLVDCYKSNQRNKVLSKTKFILSPYRSIPNNYKFIIILLIKLLYELDLAEFIDGELYLGTIYNEYNDITNDNSINKRVKDYYIKKVVSKFDRFRKKNIKNMDTKERVALSIKNMDTKEFNKINTLLKENLSENILLELKNIINENLKI